MSDDPPPGGPAAHLYKLHRILIAAAILLGVILFVWGLIMYSKTSVTSRLLVAGVGLLAAVVFSVYLRWFVVNKSRD